MARIRTIKPDFFRHEELYEAERTSGLPLRLAFAGLWTAADREGRFKWQPRALKLDCLPYDDVDFGAILSALQKAGFIVQYQADDTDAHYGYIPGWNKHQHINQREAQSVLPEPTGARTCVHMPARGEGKGREEEGKGNIDDGGGEAREALISPDAFSLTDEVSKIARVGTGLDTPPGWCGAPMRVQTWLNEGWPKEIIISAAKEAMARKRDGPPDTVNYFEKAIARAVANQSKPLPVVVIDKTPEVVHGKAQPVGNVSGAVERLASAGITFGERPRLRDGTGETPLRLISEGPSGRS